MSEVKNFKKQNTKTKSKLAVLSLGVGLLALTTLGCKIYDETAVDHTNLNNRPFFCEVLGNNHICNEINKEYDLYTDKENIKMVEYWKPAIKKKSENGEYRYYAEEGFALSYDEDRKEFIQTQITSNIIDPRELYISNKDDVEGINVSESYDEEVTPNTPIFLVKYLNDKKIISLNMIKKLQEKGIDYKIIDVISENNRELTNNTNMYEKSYNDYVRKLEK